MSCTTIDVHSLYQKDALLKSDDVKNLLKWRESQPHLPEMTELQVIFFLHSCYYDTEAAKKTIERYFTVRTNHPQAFDTPSISGIEGTFVNGILRIMPRKTAQGYSVLLTRIEDPRPETYDSLNFFKMLNMTLLLDLYQNGTNNGLVVIFDTKGMSFGHFMRINFSACKTVAAYLQEGAPVRLKALHYINIVPVLYKTVNYMRPFIKKELTDLMNFHRSLDSLYEYVPKDCLPAELGGHLSTIKDLIADHRKNVLSNLDLFEWLDSQKVDESRRQLTIKDGTSGIFGFWRRYRS